MPRGRAGGYVLSMPDEDFSMRSKEYFEDTITMALGGRAAEEIIFSQFTTGASSDLEQVTHFARSMVTRFGMSETLGPRTFGSNNGAIFLGRDIGETRDYSEQSAEEIDNEVRRILQTAYGRAKNLLIENRDKLDRLIKVLLELETLDRVAFEEVMRGTTPVATNGVHPNSDNPAPIAPPA